MTYTTQWITTATTNMQRGVVGPGASHKRQAGCTPTHGPSPGPSQATNNIYTSLIPLTDGGGGSTFANGNRMVRGLYGGPTAATNCDVVWHEIRWYPRNDQQPRTAPSPDGPVLRGPGM